jgi:uncharacterized membrane protein YeaQ/YmgE (transglycosylase-associated protein family)
MNPMLWLLTGAALGVLTSIESGVRAPGRIALDVLAGIAGSLLAGGLLAGWFLAAPSPWNLTGANEFNLAALVVAPLGAIVVLAVVHLVRLSRYP